MQQQFKVKNIKCAGCVAAIENGFADFPGVESVHVQIEGGVVTLQGDNLDVPALVEKLKQLGYPLI